MKKAEMKEFKAVLSIGTEMVDYFHLDAKDMVEAGIAAEKRFNKAFHPEISQHPEARIHVEEIVK